MRLLVLRPAIGASATAARARAAGHDPVIAPLFHYVALAWIPPDPEGFDAVLLTSAAAARLSGDALQLYHHLPVHAVGTATETAARKAGFGNVTAGSSDASAAMDALMQSGHSHVLHLVGQHHVGPAGHDIVLTRVPTYASVALSGLPTEAGPALDQGAVALLHSSRAAGTFAELLARSGRRRSDVAIACFSRTIAAAAGPGWGSIAVADRPVDDALFAAAGMLCDQDGYQGREPR